MSMMDILAELGYACTVNAFQCKEMLSLFQPLNEITISNLLAAIARTHSGLEDAHNTYATFYSAVCSSSVSDSSLLNSWNVAVLIDSISQLVIIKSADGSLSLKTNKGTVDGFSHIMFATGRIPNTKNLGLEEVGVKLAKNRAIVITQFLKTQGFLDYLARCNNLEEISNNLLDKLQDTTGRGQIPLTIFPSQLSEPEIVTIAGSDGVAGPGSKYCYKSFPPNVRTEEQEEKRRSILAGESGAHSGKHIPRQRERMVLDIKVKLQVIGGGQGKTVLYPSSTPSHHSWSAPTASAIVSWNYKTDIATENGYPSRSSPSSCSCRKGGDV